MQCKKECKHCKSVQTPSQYSCGLSCACFYCTWFSSPPPTTTQTQSPPRLLLRHSFEKLRSAQVATIHCSAQTSATHIMQKLSQVSGSNLTPLPSLLPSFLPHFSLFTLSSFPLFFFFPFCGSVYSVKKKKHTVTPTCLTLPFSLSLFLVQFPLLSLFPHSSLTFIFSPPSSFLLFFSPLLFLPLQVCMVISTNMGRVYRPRDCERLILYLKDVNLPKPDKWGTSQLIAFLQQVWDSMMSWWCNSE